MKTGRPQSRVLFSSLLASAKQQNRAARFENSVKKKKNKQKNPASDVRLDVLDVLGR